MLQRQVVTDRHPGDDSSAPHGSDDSGFDICAMHGPDVSGFDLHAMHNPNDSGFDIHATRGLDDSSHRRLSHTRLATGCSTGTLHATS
jgi:hypothetical protein